MSKRVPSGRAPGPSPFHKLSAGSVGRGDGPENRIAEVNTLGYDTGEQVSSAKAASLLGLERAVASTAESARYLERVRLAFEEVGHSNELAAQAQVADVNSAADAAFRLSTTVAENAKQAIDAQPGYFSAKSLQGLLG